MPPGERRITNTNHIYSSKSKQGLHRATQLIASLFLLILLTNCGSSSSPAARATPTPTLCPSPAACRTASPTMGATPMTTPSPTSAPHLTPTPSPNPTATAGPCEAPSGVTPVSSVEVDQGGTSKPVIALTFDAGGPSDPAPRILDILARHNNYSTWFITGQWATQNPDLVRHVWKEGHEIGNHTMDHSDLTTLSDNNVCKEFNQAESVISGITGHTTRPYYRPPYGARNDRVRQLAANLGYRTIYWTIDTLDWKSDATPQKIIDRVMSNVSNGAIILMHAGSTAESQALDQLMTMLEEKGYQMVTITQLLQ